MRVHVCTHIHAHINTHIIHLVHHNILQQILALHSHAWSHKALYLNGFHDIQTGSGKYKSNLINTVNNQLIRYTSFFQFLYGKQHDFFNFTVLYSGK